MFIKLIREIAGVTEDNLVWHNLLRLSKQTIDQARKQLSDNVTDQILNSFLRDKKFTKTEEKALNKILLKTDLVSLLETHDIDSLIGLLENPNTLNSEITSIRQKLQTYGTNANYYIQQSKSLASIMIEGEALVEDTMYNAHNIANITSVDGQTATGDVQAAEKLIDQLTSLYAIKALQDGHKSDLSIGIGIMKQEQALGKDDNGISSTLYIHQGFKEESLEKAFEGNKTQMIKGYVKEQFNPNIDIKIGRPQDEVAMNEAGYYKVHELTKDDHDPSESMVMYVSKVAGIATQVKAIASLSSRKHRGTTLFQSFLDQKSLTANVDAIVALNSVKKETAVEVAKQFNNTNISAKTKKNNHLVPIVDTKGQITDYRYLMTESTKDSVLEKSNNFAQLLGGMHGSIVDKVNSQTINRKVIAEAYKDFEENYAKNPDKFVTVGKHSTDPKYKEIYTMMPEDMKMELEAIWGNQDIKVREELIDLIFGYRKLAFSEAKFVKNFTKSKYIKGLKLDYALKQGEQIWREVVGIAKDNVVIKSVVVLRENIISNNFLLWVKGVPLSKLLTDQAEALRALADYQKELGKRDQLVRKLKLFKNLSPVIKKRIEGKINNLNASLKANVVSGLIDEGIFQSIIEDINIQENTYGFKQKIEDTTQPYIDKYVPKLATEVFKQALFTKDTFIYKKLLQATQYSDFVARYTLYKHNINTKKMNKDEALLDIIETFVNYDIPTSPEMQWLNDMGFLMFTKFLFRIQKVIFKSFKNNPVNALSTQTMQVLLGDSSDIPDSLATPLAIYNRLHGFGNTIENATFVPGYEFTLG